VSVTEPGEAPPVREASESSDGLGSWAPTSPPPRSSRVPWLVAGVLSAGLIAATVIALRRDGGLASAVGPAQFTIAPPENGSFGGPSRPGSGTATQLAVSPDGRHIVFVARATTAFQIWLQMAHRFLALVISGGVIACLIRARGAELRGTPLARFSEAWFLLLACQITLGAWVIWSNKAADIATAHVAVGATMLALGVATSAISLRLSQGSEAASTRRGYLVSEKVHAS